MDILWVKNIWILAISYFLTFYLYLLFKNMHIDAMITNAPKHNSLRQGSVI